MKTAPSVSRPRRSLPQLRGAVFAAILMVGIMTARGQGTIAFNNVPPFESSDYYEMGMGFHVIVPPWAPPNYLDFYGPGSRGVPDDGTFMMLFFQDYTPIEDRGYVVISPTNGSTFGLTSVRLADAMSPSLLQVTVTFRGVKADGSAVTNIFVTRGNGSVSFLYSEFNSDFGYGLTRVEIYGLRWAIDDLVFTAPECVLACSTNINICNDGGQCGAVVHFAPPVPNCSGVAIFNVPPSGSFFPIGTNTVLSAALDSAGHITNTCSFQVSVRDCEPPVVLCQPIHKLPAKQKAKLERDSDRDREREEDLTDCFQLYGNDNCDPNPNLFIQDSVTGFVAGPFANGDIVKITKKDGRQEVDESKAPKNPRSPIVAHLRLKGNGLLYAVDASGNVGTTVLCKAVAKGLRY